MKTTAHDTRKAEAAKRVELYYMAHPSSPSAVRQPRLYVRGKLWVALLGPDIENGIVGFGSTVEAALRAFDTQYLRALKPPMSARAA
jgi:hypothetical protein